MEIEFDDAKDSVNLTKHGVSLALGALVLENLVGEIVHDRQDYGEQRWNAFGVVEGRLFVCTYTLRLARHRMISVRRASRQEQNQWLS